MMIWLYHIISHIYSYFIYNYILGWKDCVLSFRKPGNKICKLIRDLSPSEWVELFNMFNRQGDADFTWAACFTKIGPSWITWSTLLVLALQKSGQPGVPNWVTIESCLQKGMVIIPGRGSAATSGRLDHPSLFFMCFSRVPNIYVDPAPFTLLI